MHFTPHMGSFRIQSEWERLRRVRGLALPGREHGPPPDQGAGTAGSLREPEGSMGTELVFSGPRGCK